jgi:P pilus assembly chaperone PapD
VVDPGTVVVAPSSQLTVPVTYTAGAAGAATQGSLDVATLTAGSASATLDGTSTTSAPNINLTPAALDFGTVAVGSSKKGFAYIQNVGDADLSVTSVSVTGTDFSLDNNPGAFTLLPNRQVKLRFTYTASAAGLATETLTVDSDDADTPNATVTLTGTGEAGAPAISLSSTAIDFGSVASGTSQTVNLFIQNTGTADLTVTGVTVSGNTEFSVVDTGTVIVAPSSQLTVPVTYTAGTGGVAAIQGSLDVATLAAGSASATLDGFSVAGSPDITLSTTAIDFGNVEVGATQTVNLYVKNFGTAVLNVSSLTVSGAEFSLPGGPYASFTVSPNSQVVIPVSYTPASEAPATTGSVDIVSDAGSPSVTLDGVGIAPGA